jgi:hypothetical protein
MKRILIASAVGVALFAIVAYAATLTVGSGTAATGNGDVASCGDVTGSTFVLMGQDVNPKTGAFPVDPGQAVMTDTTPTDITKTTQVNIETGVNDSCVGINVNVQLQGPDGNNLPGATGSCEVFDGGGLGYDEVGTSDNTDGCTVDLAASQDIAPISEIVVTEN